MKFILTKVRTIQDMTPSYNTMTWKKIDIRKYENIEPLELTSIELKTAVAVIKGSKSVHAQREIVTELMLSCTEQSFAVLCTLLGEKLLNKIMPTC